MSLLPFTDRKPWAEFDLICLPYAGGSSALFRDWDSYFPPWISARPVEYPGRGTRMGEGLITDPFEMVDHLNSGLKRELTRPWAIFGHSLGAAFGYEMAKAPAADGFCGFFPSGRHSPTHPDPAPRRAHLPDAELTQEVRALNGSPPEVLENKELLQLVLPIIRADFTLSEAIADDVAIRPLTCPVHVFGAKDDPEVPYCDLDAWNVTAGGPFDLTLLEGDHFFLHRTDAVETFQRHICKALSPLRSSANVTCQAV